MCGSFLDSHQLFTWPTVVNASADEQLLTELILLSDMKCRLIIILKIVSHIIEFICSISKESCFFKSPGRKI